MPDLDTSALDAFVERITEWDRAGKGYAAISVAVGYAVKTEIEQLRKALAEAQERERQMRQQLEFAAEMSEAKALDAARIVAERDAAQEREQRVRALVDEAFAGNRRIDALDVREALDA
jgi:hypothetical protein